MNDRTLRQRLVPEIGDDGQARIAKAIVAIDHDDLEGDIRARYLEHAGFAELRTGRSLPAHGRSASTEALAREPFDEAVRAVAVGAARALDELRRAVKGDA